MLYSILIELLPYYSIKFLQSYKIYILITSINSRQRAVNFIPLFGFQQQKKKVLKHVATIWDFRSI